MKWESGTGSDLANKPPCHVEYFVVLAEAAAGWETGTGSHLNSELLGMVQALWCLPKLP